MYNTYFSIIIPNGSELEKAQHKLEKEKLLAKVEELKAKHIRDKERLIHSLGHSLGIWKNASLNEVKAKAFELRDEVERLKKELKQSKDTNNNK